MIQLIVLIVILVFSSVFFLIGKEVGRKEFLKKLYKDGDINEKTYKNNL